MKNLQWLISRIVFTCVFLHWGSSFAASKIETLSVFDGLSNPQIYAIARDQKGFMWFGTADGVKRFNGYQFSAFRHDPLALGSLSNNNVGVMLIDSKDRLWVGTWGGGVNRFIPESAMFVRYKHSASQSDSLSADRVQALFESRNGDIWIGTNGGGLNRYNAHDDAFKAWKHQPDDRHSISHNRIWSIAEDDSGKLWVGTSNGLNAFDPQSEHFVRYAAREQGLDHPEVRSVFVDTQQRIWVATRLSFGLFDPVEQRYQLFDLPDGTLPSVTNITQVGKHLLLATFAGVYKFDLENKLFVAAGEKGNWGLLENRDVRQVMQDSTGILWAATRYSGVVKVFQNPPPFKGWRNFLQDYQLSGLFNQVVSLHGAGEQNIWLGTGRSLVRFDGTTQFTPHMSETNLRNLNRLRILNISRASDGKIWLATDNGLYRLSDDEKQLIKIQIPWLETSDQAIDWVSTDKNGALWIIAAGENRVALWQPGSQQVRYFLERVDPNFVFVDESKTAWVGTAGDGLFAINTITGDIEHFLQGQNSTLSANFINDALQDEIGNIWFATRRGVDRFDPKSRTFQPFILSRENTDIAVQSMVMDHHDNLWMASNQGIFRLEPKTGKQHHFTTNDGLHSNNFLARSALKTADGTIYFGSIDGLTGFHPDQVIVNRVPPPVVITKVSIDGRQLATVPDALEVPHNYRNVRIDFAALDYQATEDNRYRTRISGYIDEWSDITPLPEITFGRLEPGEYRFEVMGSNNHGIWNMESVGLNLVVNPAWYQTLWFQIAVALTLLTIVVLSYWIKVRQHTRIQAYLSAKVEQRTQDILVLGDVGRDVAMTFDPAAIAEKIFHKLRAGIAADAYGFAVLDNKAQELRFIYAEQAGKDIAGQVISLSDSGAPSVRCVTSGDQVFVQSEPQWQSLNLTSELCLNGPETHSVICEPLRSKDGVVGVITIQSNQPGAFDTSHLSMLRVVASHAAVALQNTIAYQELAEAEERLELAMEGANAGMWQWDLSNNQLITSPIWATMLHYDPEQLYEMYGNTPEKFEQLVHPEDLPLAAQLLQQHIAGQSETYRAEFRMRNGRGEWQWLLSVGQAVKESGDSGAQRIFGIHLDISDDKALQDALQEAKDKAEQATQAKSDFLSNMSHEIRTPMNAIIGMSHLALQTELNRKQHNYISKVHSSAESLLRIINDILDFSKIEAGKMDIEYVPFNLEDVLDNLANVMGFKAAEKHIQFYFDIAAQTPLQLLGDPLRLGQVLLNLGNNAIKFSHEQGEVNIKVAVQTTFEDKVLLRFQVQDNGIGMTTEQTERLFKSFSQADSTITRKYGGTGLGLAICKDLVELMGGDIWVESEPEIGSVFSCTILCGKAVAANDFGQQPLQNCSVLLLDESPLSLQITTNLLLEAGCEVLAAGSAVEIAAKLNQGTFPAELLLLDWNMTAMSVQQAYDEIVEALTPDNPLKTIALTRFGQEEPNNESAIALIDSIAKPLLPGYLQRCLLRAKQSNIDDAFIARDNGEDAHNLENLNGADILLVEDNALNQELALELLAMQGVVVTVAENGQIAIELLQKKRFDAVLMDCQMPVMDGYTATRLIRQELSTELPVIAMTANAMAEDIELALSSGMNDHISKPIDPERLYRTLANWLPDREPAQMQHTRTESLTSVEHDGQQSYDDPLSNDVLAELTLLNAKAGLTTCANNTKLYRRLLEGFLRQQDCFSRDLQEALASGDSATAIRLTHTLKGNAGNIGAKSTLELCSQFEDCLKQGKISPEPLLHSLTEQLVRLKNDIEIALDNLSDDSTATPSEFPVTKDIDGLLSLFNKLKLQLQDYDTAAEDSAEALLELMPDNADTWHKVLMALDAFDFEAAKSLVDCLPDIERLVEKP